MQEINTATKIAFATVAMCFVIGIAMSLLFITKAFWSRTENSIESAMVNTAAAEVYQVASYGKPVPIASIWKSLEDAAGVNRQGTGVRNFQLYDYDGNLISNDYQSLKDHLGDKGYLSYEEVAGLYDVIIDLAE